MFATKYYSWVVVPVYFNTNKCCPSGGAANNSPLSTTSYFLAWSSCQGSRQPGAFVLGHPYLSSLFSASSEAAISAHSEATFFGASEAASQAQSEVARTSQVTQVLCASEVSSSEHRKSPVRRRHRQILPVRRLSRKSPVWRSNKSLISSASEAALIYWRTR